jgi:hypothetical protein
LLEAFFFEKMKGTNDLGGKNGSFWRAAGKWDLGLQFQKYQLLMV